MTDEQPTKLIQARTELQGFAVWKSFRDYCRANGLKIGAALVQAMQLFMGRKTTMEMTFDHFGDSFEVHYLPHRDCYAIKARNSNLHLLVDEFREFTSTPAGRRFVWRRMLEIEGSEIARTNHFTTTVIAIDHVKAQHVTNEVGHYNLESGELVRVD